MVDDSDMDLRIAELFYGRSHLKNKFVPLNSAAQLLSYLEARKADESRAPALVLLDINMPEMTGFEVLERIRGDHSFAVQPKIMMFTHSSFEDDKQRASSLGADGYMVKPMVGVEYLNFFESLL